ncbi:hypothetical protein Lal_00005982 [Lupinus albus]|nr:hypothetical protein Lal_00005982 [Lupinus albus]
MFELYSGLKINFSKSSLIQLRLAFWKSNQISFSGRVILINFVLSTPMYITCPFIKLLSLLFVLSKKFNTISFGERLMV